MDTVVGNLKMDIPLGIILALLTVVAVWFLLEKTKLGYELKAVGYSRSAAKYAGIKVGRSMVLSMTISGALAGLAGVTYYLGYVGSIQPKVLISTGFDAIAVSLLGNNNPFGIVFSTMLITLISKGSTYMKSAAGVDAEQRMNQCKDTSSYCRHDHGNVERYRRISGEIPCNGNCHKCSDKGTETL